MSGLIYEALANSGVRLNNHNLISFGTTNIGIRSDLTTGCIYLIYSN